MQATINEWIGFHLVVIFFLFWDLLLHRKHRVIPMREALLWSCIWIAAALLFSLFIFFAHGRENALIFLTGYVVEKALSIDNLFVFVLIFSYFQTPAHLLHDVLFWGVLGAIIFRGVFIALGIVLIQHFHWILYLFGFFLIVMGIKFAFDKEKEIHPEKNPLLRLTRKFFSITHDYQDAHFFVRKRKKIYATPLFIVLIAIETTDIIFALDSIPVIFGITQNPFLAYTSNIFAILGLRALYFVLSGLLPLFYYLHYGLAAILVFIGVKMLVAKWMTLPVPWTLGIVLFILTISILASIWIKPQAKT